MKVLSLLLIASFTIWLEISSLHIDVSGEPAQQKLGFFFFYFLVEVVPRKLIEAQQIFEMDLLVNFRL